MRIASSLRFFAARILPGLKPRGIAIGLLLLTAGCASAPPKIPLPPLRVSPLGYSATEAPRAAENLRVFDAVWNEINRGYYDPKFNGVDWTAAATEFAPKAAAAKDEAALYAVLDLMLDRLADGHTGASPPAEARDRKKQQLTGIGIHFTIRENRFVVTEVMPGGAAKSAGVLPGWALVSRDGLPVEKIAEIPLKAGKVAKWEFLDLTGARVELALATQEISTVHRESRLLRGGIGYLRFDEFDFDVIPWLRDRVSEYRNAPGLILDLRENPGGTVIAAMYAIGHFVDHSQIVMVTIDRDETRQRHVPLGKTPAMYRGKLAVLVSGESGSGSEILAAAIQERGRGTIIGQKTAGSVLEAWQVGLPDGGELQYSASDLLTARGVRLEGIGVTPDILVPEPTDEDLRNGRDAALDRALEEMTKS